VNPARPGKPQDRDMQTEDKLLLDQQIQTKVE
jgi:hypothetical protein